MRPALFLLVLCEHSQAFSFPSGFLCSGSSRLSGQPLQRASCSCLCSHEQAANPGRRALLGAVTLSSLHPLLEILPADATAEQRPVLVLGASGGTGRACVDYLIARGRPCIAATRTGEFDGLSSPLLTLAKADVTSALSMAAAITPGRLSGVIYAASASRQAEAKATSNAKAVDRDGVVECAKLCIANKVPRMVLVSSGGVSKPTSAVYLFLNLAANGIMDAKIRGEDQMRALYLASGVADAGLGYTIVRPGGLTRDPPRGVGAVELNQGDTKSGRISRSDVAAICVECLESAAAFDTTFECYDADTGKDLDTVMQSNAKGIATGTREASDASTGRERRATSWPKLFEGLEADRDARSS